MQVCSLLSYEALSLSNQLQPIIYSNGIVKVFAKSKKEGVIKEFINEISSIDLFKKSLNVKDFSSTIGKITKKKSLIILVGDFLDFIDLSYLHKKHELFIVIVRSQFEENPTHFVETEFVDPETGENASFYFGKGAKKEYKKRIIENDTKIYKHLNKLGIKHLKIITDADPFLQLLKYQK